MKREKFEIIRGSGNVFRDLGLPNADLKHLKAILTAEIIKAAATVEQYVGVSRQNCPVISHEDVMFETRNKAPALRMCYIAFPMRITAQIQRENVLKLAFSYCRFYCPFCRPNRGVFDRQYEFRSPYSIAVNGLFSGN